MNSKELQKCVKRFEGEQDYLNARKAAVRESLQERARSLPGELNSALSPKRWLVHHPIGTLAACAGLAGWAASVVIERRDGSKEWEERECVCRISPAEKDKDVERRSITAFLLGTAAGMIRRTVITSVIASVTESAEEGEQQRGDSR